ncbi:MAG TPA: DUF4126 domain-containing protein [Deltaproteobacteria bacterium]|nr:DUF4126 domain-containing protein [Deltaproteobacteria bacterium]
MEALLSIAVGIGLAAACGFRVFVPLLILNLAALSGYFVLPQGFMWLVSPLATVAFAIATLLEITGYYIPWVDNVLDSIATPASVIAFFKLTLAIIAGGGVAGIVQASTVALRAQSSLATTGAANPLLSTFELGGSVAVALLAIFIPILALFLIIVFFLGRAQNGQNIFG